MYKSKIKPNNVSKQSGFALLIALIVVGVVVSVGLTLLDLTIKQLGLSTNSRDSEMAFHAANAGLECASYWRNYEYANLESGNNITLECFGDTDSDTPITDPSAGDGESHLYHFQFDWGPTGAERCSDVRMLLMVSDNGTTGSVVNNVDDVTMIPSYPYGSTKTCEPGGRCAVISVRGYNKTCSNIGSTGTLEREVLLES
ncbi:MAG: hypothetical protein R3B60_02410 [Candidatus Paceibacterota bacterium]